MAVWNKGLTKETDNRIKKLSEIMKIASRNRGRRKNKIIYQNSKITKFLIKTLKNGSYEVIIDTEDWNKINKYYWYPSKINNYIYISTCINYKAVVLPRFIMNVNDSKILIDHKDHNRLNNKKNNLRKSTISTNTMNRIIPKNNTSGYKGVVWRDSTKKWRAIVQYKNKKYEIGNFKDKIEAAKAYNKKATELFGEFAYLNKV